MYITFKNYSTSEKMIISFGNQKITVNPESSVDAFHSGDKLEFEAQINPFEELLEGIDEIDENDKNESFKDRMLTKLTKKAIKKIPEIVLNIAVKYEISFSDYQNPVVNLFDGAYSVCDGKLADFFDMVPVAMCFSRAETDCGEIKVTDVEVLNRKRFLRLVRNILLFVHWGFLLIDLLFFFVPEYTIVKFCSSHFFVKRLLGSLYKKPPLERARILAEKELRYEDEKEEGCLTYILKGLIALAVIIGIFVWAGSGE